MSASGGGTTERRREPTAEGRAIGLSWILVFMRAEGRGLVILQGARRAARAPAEVRTRSGRRSLLVQARERRSEVLLFPDRSAARSRTRSGPRSTDLRWPEAQRCRCFRRGVAPN
jgi:hypothetical protein